MTLTVSDNKTNAKILVVDDEPDILEVVELALNRFGYEVVTAGGGHEAVAVYDRERPEAVLTDVRMANGNGRELAQNLRTKSLDVPILFMTGFSDVAIDAAYAIGVNEVILKPFDFRTLAYQVAWHMKPIESRLAPNSGGPEPVVRAALKPEAVSVVKLGRGGVFIADAGNTALAPDDGVSLELRCDEAGGNMLRGVGVCRWVRAADHPLGRGIGVELLQLDDESRRWFAAHQVTQKHTAYIPASAC